MHHRIIHNRLQKKEKESNKTEKTTRIGDETLIYDRIFSLPPQHFLRFDLESFGQRKSCSGFNLLEYSFNFSRWRFFIESNSFDKCRVLT